jgi:site-specific recombinase XerD
MYINIKSTNKEIITILEDEGYAQRTSNDQKRFSEALQKHLYNAKVPFSMKNALEWLEDRKPSWSKDTYTRYRRALYRLKKYLECGEIGRDPHCGNNNFAYHDAEDVSYIKLPDNYKELYCTFYKTISNERAKQTVDHYVVGCTDFLLFIAEQGYASPAEMTIAQPIAYLQRIHKKNCSKDKKSKYAEGVGQLLSYLANIGSVPRCYSHIMSKLDNETYIASLKMVEKSPTEKAFHPSKILEHRIESFLRAISERRYSAPPERMFGHVFRNFSIFLEINHMEYSQTAVKLWLKQVPKTTSWDMKRQVITWFTDYIETGRIVRAANYVWRSLLIDTLPGWSRSITEDYMAMRQKEDRALSTLMMIRSSCARFFLFLDSHGIQQAEGITPMLVKEFHDTDLHATPQAKNAYGVRIRQLLKFMAEKNLAPQNLYLAISTQYAESRGIVMIMDEDMISAVYDYRQNATNPAELRNTAMVMMGLRMGIRASDIVNIKISEMDLKNKKVSFVQRKTGKSITLSIPTDVGNSIYKYVMQGRPTSCASGDGYVFIRHKSPYSNLSSSVCRHALVRILGDNGLSLPFGQGFHITRRTFATRLLKARTKVDDLVDALGHASRTAVDNYLAHDEEGMLLCPLPFTIGGAQ